MRRGHRRNPVVSLVHPVTPAASSFVSKHLAPTASRRATDLLRQYDPVASRGGLVLLRRGRRLKRRKTSGSDLCVYDPMSGTRTSLSEPPDISIDDESSVISCVLLTSADGIGCSSFLLLVAAMSINPMYGHTMRVQTAASPDVSWGPVTEYICNSRPFKNHGGAVVLRGGVIHWLVQHDNEILAYDVRTRNLYTIEHPEMSGHRHLSMSSDGGLRMLVVRGFLISIWLQLSTGGWAHDAVIDTEEKMRSLDTKTSFHDLARLNLRCSGDTRSNAVLLRIDRRPIIVLDMETSEMRKQEDGSSFSFPFEVDLPARLQAMKDFS
jgi:hypothetical protein